MTDNTDETPAPNMTGLKRRIAVMRFVASAVMVAERLLVSALPLLAVLSLFLICSWFGLWRSVPTWPKLAITIGFAAALIWAALRLRAFRWPEASTVDRRLESRSGLSHQALTIQTEQPVGDDPFARALWKSHQARMASRISTIESGGPSPDIARHDPFAMRAVVVLLVVIAWTFSWSNFGGRVADVLDYSGSPDPSASSLRIDAWVTPPTYTAVAPIYLSVLQTNPSDPAVRIPQFSELTIRTSGEGSDGDLHPDRRW